MSKEEIVDLFTCEDGTRYARFVGFGASTNLHRDTELASLRNGVMVMGDLASNSLIHFKPQLFLSNNQAPVSLKSSSVKIKVQSVATESLVADKELKVNHPFPNKKYVAGYSFVNRKRLSGLLHSPAADEALTYSDFFKMVFQSSGFFMNWGSKADFEYVEKILFEKSVLTSSDKSNPYTTLDEYLDYKYEIYPYWVSENWTIGFDIDGHIFNVPLLIEYYTAIIKHTDAYLADNNIDPVVNYADDNDRTTGQVFYSDHGRIPCLQTVHGLDLKLAYDGQDYVLDNCSFYHGGVSSPGADSWRYDIVWNYDGRDITDKYQLLADDKMPPLSLLTKEYRLGGFVPITGLIET